MLFIMETRSGIKQVGVVVTLQTCIREMLGSNLGPDTGYPHLEFSRVFPVPPCKPRNNTPIRQLPLPSKSFPIHNSPVIPYILHSIVWDIENVVK
jgi:hypothetical protein